jgi:hypothetical protein
MIQLLHYQLSLHVRLISTYVMLSLILLTFGLVNESRPADLGEMAGMKTMMISSFIMIWVTLTFVIQLTTIHHFFFRPEALQYRLARIRNRPLIVGTLLVHVAMLALIASLPYALIYFGLLDDFRIAMLSWLNMVAFFMFIGITATLIQQRVGSTTTSSIVLIVLLFMVPMGLGSLDALAPSFANSWVGDPLITFFQSHLDVSSNPSMLALRGIQDSDALLRTLILIPILATITYVHFLRGDHH